jgi:hypothetical protein
MGVIALDSKDLMEALKLVDGEILGDFFFSAVALGLVGTIRLVSRRMVS